MCLACTKQIKQKPFLERGLDMKRNLIVFVLFVSLLAVSFLFVGCGDKEESEVDADLVTFEDAVIDSSLIIDDNLVTQTMIFNDDIKLEDVTRIAEEKAAELKAEYPDSTINVQAVQKGRNVSDIVLD